MVKNNAEKVWYKSKTVWTAIVVAVIVILQELGIQIPVSYEVIYGVLAAFGIFGVRDAVGKIKKK